MEIPLEFSEDKMQFASFKTGETKIEIFPNQNYGGVIGEHYLLPRQNQIEILTHF